MKVEELLMPRYQVIADYPHNPYKIGDLLEEFTKTAFKLTVTYNGNSMDETQANTYPISAIEKMPHLFRKLKWHEERSKEDFLCVKYVKTISGNSIRAVEGFDLWWDKIILVGGKVKPISKWLPATSEQYNDYINSKSNAKPKD